MLSVPALSSETVAENSMQLTIDIPEDYGIEVPKDVLRLDRFVFGYEIGGERHHIRGCGHNAGTFLAKSTRAIAARNFFDS